MEVRDEELREIARNKYEKAKIEKEELANKIKVLPDIIEDDRNKIKEYIQYIEEIGENLFSYPLLKKRALLIAIFEYVIISEKKVIEFKLKPFFEFIYNRKVLTGGGNDGEQVRTNKKKTTDPKTDLGSLEDLNGGAKRVRLELFAYYKQLTFYDISDVKEALLIV